MKKLLVTTALLAALGTSSFAFAERGEGGMRRDGPPPHVREAMEKLPEDKRELVRETMKDGRENHREMRETVEKLHKEAEAILIAEKFDKGAFIAKMKEIHDFHGQMQKQMADNIAKVAEQMNAEERKILAEIMPGPGKHGGKGMKKRRHHMEDGDDEGDDRGYRHRRHRDGGADDEDSDERDDSM